MVSEMNKQIARRVVEEVYNRKNLAAAAELCSTSVLEAVQQDFILNTISSSDLRVTVEDIIAERDKVAVRYSVQATCPEGLPDESGPKRTIHWTGIAMVRIAGGRIVEYWVEADVLRVMRQLAAFGTRKVE